MATEQLKIKEVGRVNQWMVKMAGAVNAYTKTEQKLSNELEYKHCYTYQTSVFSCPLPLSLMSVRKTGDMASVTGL